MGTGVAELVIIISYLVNDQEAEMIRLM
jgi:hypothetical protein